MGKNQTPLYATLLYEVREKLDISWLEYIYLDMVYHLSQDGWCYKSLDNSAQDMGISRVGLIKMRKRLIERNLLRKNIRGHVKPTVTVNKVYRKEDQGVNKVYSSVNKVYSSGKLSLPKNNNRVTVNIKGNENKGKHSPAKEKLRAMLKEKGILKSI